MRRSAPKLDSDRPAGDAERQRRFALLAWAFVLSGGATVFLGPLVPELRQAWDAGSGQIGWLFTAQFATSALGSLLSTYHLRRSLIGGYAAMGLGLLWMSQADFASAVLAVGLIGFGLGTALPATNLLIAADFPERRGAALAKLNLYWGLGAAGFPLLLAQISPYLPLRSALAGLGLLCLLTVPLLVGSAMPRRLDGKENPESAGGGTNLKAFLPFTALLFLYVGTEVTFGGWLVSLASTTVDQPRFALWIGAAFWIALLVGRAVAVLLLRHWTEHRLYLTSLASAFAGTLLLLFFPVPAGVLLGACLGGFGLAPLYPLTISLLTRRSDRLGDSRTGWVFIGSGLGGALLPWMAGQIQETSGRAEAGFLVAAVGLVLIVSIYLMLREVRHRTAGDLGTGSAGAISTKEPTSRKPAAKEIVHEI